SRVYYCEAILVHRDFNNFIFISSPILAESDVRPAMFKLPSIGILENNSGVSSLVDIAPFAPNTHSRQSFREPACFIVLRRYYELSRGIDKPEFVADFSGPQLRTYVWQ